MADLLCLDGTRLVLRPEPVLDRRGVPYEALLRVGDVLVGQRCHWALERLAARLDAGDLDDVLLDLRRRDPDDPRTDGELRVTCRQVPAWTGDGDGRGGWSLQPVVVVDAWTGGRGRRAELSPEQLRPLVGQLLDEVAACYETALAG